MTSAWPFAFPLPLRDVGHGETVNLALESDLTTYDARCLWLADHLGAELIKLDPKLGKIAQGRQGRKRHN